MAARSSVSVALDKSGDLQKAIKGMLRREVAIGIPDSGAERQPEDGEKGTPPSNALIGYVMEFGDDEKRIPPRPFLIPGVEDAKDQIVKQLAKAGGVALSGSSEAVDRGLGAAGLVGQNAVRAKITDGPFTPLSQATIEARARRGRKGAKQYLKLQGQGVPEDVLQDAALVKPLIDSGQLRASITYVVRNKGDR